MCYDTQLVKTGTLTPRTALSNIMKNDFILSVDYLTAIQLFENDKMYLINV